MPRTITFQSSSELSECIETLGQTHAYKSNQREVVRHGLCLLKEEVAVSKLQQLKVLIEDGDSSPDAEGFTMSAIKCKLDTI